MVLHTHSFACLLRKRERKAVFFLEASLQLGVHRTMPIRNFACIIARKTSSQLKLNYSTFQIHARFLGQPQREQIIVETAETHVPCDHGTVNNASQLQISAVLS